MIVTLSSVRGSPGVTSWSLLLGAAWPVDYRVERVVLEADRDGGVLGARYQLGVDPGVPTLVAALRRHGDGGMLPVAEFGRPLADGLWLVPQPESAEQCAAVWGSLSTTHDVAAAIAGEERVWLVDAGRLGPSSAALPFSARSAMTLVFCRAGQEDLVQIPARVAALQRLGVPVGVVVVGKPSYGRDELAEFFGTGLVWEVPDAKDLPSWAGAVLNGRRARRSWLWRAAVDLAGDLAERLMRPDESVDLNDGFDRVEQH